MPCNIRPYWYWGKEENVIILSIDGITAYSYPYKRRGETMIIKTGSVVSHPGATAWGVGKVVEVAALKATIQFSDGIIRKIASSHYAALQPADPASFIPVPDSVPAEKTKKIPKKPKKAKELAV
jgi:hypothetical protein